MKNHILVKILSLFLVKIHCLALGDKITVDYLICQINNNQSNIRAIYTVSIKCNVKTIKCAGQIKYAENTE